MLNKKLYEKNSSVFSKYIALTNQKQILVGEITEKISKHFALNYKKNLTLLDIGAGDGKVIVPIIENLKKKFDLRVICIEPSRDLINEIKKKTEFPISFIQKNIEDIDLPKADFILMAHLFGYIDNPQKEIQKVFKAINENGLGLIVIDNNESDDSKLRRQVLHNYKNISEELEEILATDKISYEKETVKSEIDVSGCSTMNENGKTIISFLRHKIFSELKELEVEELRSFILKLAKNNKLTKIEDYLWIFKK